ncbi:MAG: glutathione S-transferase C-terminal domain-containing protein [Gemmatimonadota bacterium]|nr:glutathione S-transferase C-terminal domain-containing protein [Gemmatimonadota bacterium]
MLHGRDYLFGEGISAADYLAFPFLKYARGIDENDRHVFHVVLERWLRSHEHPRLDAWIDRIDARPRAGDVAVHRLPAD